MFETLGVAGAFCCQSSHPARGKNLTEPQLWPHFCDDFVHVQHAVRRRASFATSFWQRNSPDQCACLRACPFVIGTTIIVTGASWTRLRRPEWYTVHTRTLIGPQCTRCTPRTLESASLESTRPTSSTWGGGVEKGDASLLAYVWCAMAAACARGEVSWDQSSSQV
jgi:hypothetical protein